MNMSRKRAMPEKKQSMKEPMDKEVRIIRKGDHSMDQHLSCYQKKSKKRVSLTANRMKPNRPRKEINMKMKKYEKELEGRVSSWEQMLGRKLNYNEMDQVLEAAESAGDISD